VSRICADLDEEVAAFRDRPLSELAFPYVFLDATYCTARVNRRIVNQAVVIAFGVAADGHREVLGFAVRDSESEPFWTAFLRSSPLAFAAVASLALYGMFVVTQTVRHRDFLLPVHRTAAARTGRARRAAQPSHRRRQPRAAGAGPGRRRRAGAKVESPAIEAGVAAAGFPASFVGVVIALLVLLPETLAAGRAARQGLTQTSLDPALGSAMASIGLTIPFIALASVWLEGPLVLGLEPTQLVLLALTVFVGVLTVVPGRATRLQGGIHLVLLAAFLFLAVHQ
jgi:Ca2+:H+ antiporter